MDLDVPDSVPPRPTTPSCPQTVIFIDRSALSVSSSSTTTSVRDIQELMVLERVAKSLSSLPVPLRSQILLADPNTPPAELDTAWCALQPSFRSRAGAARLEIKRDKYNGQDQKQQQRSLKVLSLVMARWREAHDEGQPFAKSVFGLNPYTDIEETKENAWMDRHRANLEQLLRGECSSDPAAKSGILTVACTPRRMELFLDAMSVLSSSERQVVHSPFLPDSSTPANLASSSKILLGCVATAQVESDAEMCRWSPFKIDLEAKMVYVYDVAVGLEATTEMDREEDGERLSQVKSIIHPFLRAIPNLDSEMVELPTMTATTITRKRSRRWRWYEIPAYLHESDMTHTQSLPRDTLTPDVIRDTTGILSLDFIESFLLSSSTPVDLIHITPEQVQMCLYVQLDRLQGMWKAGRSVWEGLRLGRDCIGWLGEGA